MNECLTNSILFRIFGRLTRWFIKSNTCKVLYIILDWCKNSAINRVIVRYLARNSSLYSSRTYKICSRLFGFFDRLWDKLYNFGTACSGSSAAISFIREAFGRSDSLTPYSLIILFFSLGFAVTSALLGSFDTIKAGLTGVCIIAALLLSISKEKWKACFQSSIFWRFALYIFD